MCFSTSSHQIEISIIKHHESIIKSDNIKTTYFALVVNTSNLIIYYANKLKLV